MTAICFGVLNFASRFVQNAVISPISSACPDFSTQIAGTCMKCPSVFRQLHAARRPVQKPDTDIFFQLPDRR